MWIKEEDELMRSCTSSFGMMISLLRLSYVLVAVSERTSGLRIRDQNDYSIAVSTFNWFNFTYGFDMVQWFDF